MQTRHRFPYKYAITLPSSTTTGSAWRKASHTGTPQLFKTPETYTARAETIPCSTVMITDRDLKNKNAGQEENKKGSPKTANLMSKIKIEKSYFSLV